MPLTGLFPRRSPDLHIKNHQYDAVMVKKYAGG